MENEKRKVEKKINGLLYKQEKRKKETTIMYNAVTNTNVYVYR